MGYFNQAHPTVLSDLVGPGDHVRGPTAADVTLLEYGDFACPSCRAAYGTVREVLNRNPDVRFVFRANPRSHLFPDAEPAAEAAELAGVRGKFWEMHDRLFANQNSLEPAMLTSHAQAIGVDAKKFQACLDSGKYAADIRKDIAEANKYGITGTPTTVIGLTQTDGKIKVLKVIRGAQNIAAFKEALDSLANEKPAAAEKKAAR